MARKHRPGRPAAEAEQAAPKSQAWLGLVVGAEEWFAPNILCGQEAGGSDNGENAGRGRAAT